MVMRAENPFRGLEELSNRQLLMGGKWNKRKITKDALLERGVKINPADAEKYQQRRKQFEMMKNVEHGVMAELMFFEGADEDGMTKPKNPYHWFGELVYAYPANELDDVLRGADAMLMFTDEEDERTAHPLVVDVKTQKADYDERAANALFYSVSQIAGPSRYYWADTASEPGAPAFDEPSEGSIEAPIVAAYIPANAVNEFRSNKTGEPRAQELMHKLGPHIRKQIQVQLEALLALLAGNVQVADIRTGALKSPITRESVERLIKRPPTLAGSQLKLFKEAAAVLQRIWAAQDAADDSYLTFLEEDVPPSLRSAAAAEGAE